jgi:hypothetical protein
MRSRHPRTVIIRELDDLSFTFCQLRRFLHWVHLEVLHLPCIGFTSRVGLSPLPPKTSSIVWILGRFSYGAWCARFLATPECNLDDLAPESFNDAFLNHHDTDLGFGGLRIVLLDDDGLVWDSDDFPDPWGIKQSYPSSSYDCYFPSSYVFLPRLMAFGSFFKLVF